jgi:hydrogenase/urease accessory protein HupE
MSRRKWLACLIAITGLTASAQAHDPGLSSATLTVGDREITAAVIFNARDIASASAGKPAANPSLAPDILLLRVAGKAIPTKLDAVERDQNANVVFRLSYIRPTSGPIELSSGIIDRLPFGHRQFVSIHSATGVSLGDHFLSARENHFAIELAAAPTASSFRPGFVDFLLLGIRHILTGYDHLLFLFGLLIVCRNARAAAVLITCFTVAHSFTLALSTFGLVNLQSRVVEPAIAASIVYVGIENLWGKSQLSGRWILTLVFGLVHGLGFASVLREMGVANTGIQAAIPLLAFNLGVELGQLSVAAIALPLIWRFRQHPAFLKSGIPACSLVIALAGSYWFLERTWLS